jgi:hypothetical protein
MILSFKVLMVGDTSPSQKLAGVVVCGGPHVCIVRTKNKIEGGYKNCYLSAMEFLEDLKYIEELGMVIQLFIIEEEAIVVKYTTDGELVGVTDIKFFTD